MELLNERPVAPFVGVDRGTCGNCAHEHNPELEIQSYWCGHSLGLTTIVGGGRCDCVEYELEMVPNVLCRCQHYLDGHAYGDGDQPCEAEVGDGYCWCERFVEAVPEMALAG